MRYSGSGNWSSNLRSVEQSIFAGERLKAPRASTANPSEFLPSGVASMLISSGLRLAPRTRRIMKKPVKAGARAQGAKEHAYADLPHAQVALIASVIPFRPDSLTTFSGWQKIKPPIGGFICNGGNVRSFFARSNRSSCEFRSFFEFRRSPQPPNCAEKWTEGA